MSGVSFEYERIGESSYQILDSSMENIQYKLHGYVSNPMRRFFYHLISILSLGIPYYLSNWFPLFKAVKFKEASLKQATLIMVEDDYGNSDLLNIKITIVKIPNGIHLPLRYFYYQHTKYVWIPQLELFGTLDLLIPAQRVDVLLNNTAGLFYDNYIDFLKIYGINKIEIEVKSYWRLFIDEVFNPFYVFQVFSMILWALDDYIIYAVVVFILTFFSIITALRQTRKQSEALHDLVESSNCSTVTVIRQTLLSETVLQDIDSIELVPGDLIVLPKTNFTIPCDIVLLTGQCIVNESMLTGESVPVVKTSLHSGDELYCSSTHKRHTLFAGTEMLQSRNYGGEHVLARVMSTGFNTTKGALVKSILYPTPINLKFYKDSLKFVFALFIIASFGMAYCFYLYIQRHADIKEIILRSLDIVTIVVPPALPAAMTVGIVYSQNRLKKLRIFCISPPKINICGKIKLACFDKTGTLTQDGLDIHSVVPAIDSKFLPSMVNCQLLETSDKLLQAMATCHSLTQIDGKLTGDPLDLSMFDFTEWTLDEPGTDETARFDMLAPSIVKPLKLIKMEEMGDAPNFPYQIGIIRQFPFSSSLQSMSVICREINSNSMIAFTKGAPERVATMCLAQTLPPDYFSRLAQYAAKGYRIIALAYKTFPVRFKWKEAQRAKREIIECDLTFLGLLVMQNSLKCQTAPVIKTLHDANIRTVMITGDNILTAISVARDCEMIKPFEEIFILDSKTDDNHVNPSLFLQNTATNGGRINDTNFSNCHLAIDGKTWNTIKNCYPDLLPYFLVRTTIFARFQPDQKTQLVTHFQSLDYVVSMVGDGANDCGALKAAHVGVSLSEAEASVAAPFTSGIQDISCIIHLILEGRCALVTSFAVFKYMALYSLIQFVTILILYKQHSILGDYQFLFIDLIITTVLAVTIGRQGPSNRVEVRRPPGSLVSPNILIPLIAQVFICIFIQLLALYYLYCQDWFEPVPSGRKEEVVVCWENTVLFLVSSFQYLTLAVIYSKGRPYRQLLITNFWFLFSALSLLCFQVWLLIMPTRKVAEFFEIMFLPHTAHEQIRFRYKLSLIPLLHFFCAFLIEAAIADRIWFRRLNHFLTCKWKPKNKYKAYIQESDHHLQQLSFEE